MPSPITVPVRLLILRWLMTEKTSEPTDSTMNTTQIGWVKMVMKLPFSICMKRLKFASDIGPRISASRMGESGKSYFCIRYPISPNASATPISNTFWLMA